MKFLTPTVLGLLVSLTVPSVAQEFVDTQIPRPISDVIQEFSEQTVVPLDVRRTIAERCASVKLLYAITQENTGFNSGDRHNTPSFNHRVGIYFYVQLAQDKLNQRLDKGEELSENVIENTSDNVFEQVTETANRYRQRIASGETALTDELVVSDSETCTRLFLNQTG